MGRSAHRDQHTGPARQCRSPDLGNPEQHIADHEQDRRQSIDDHYAEDDLVTSTLWLGTHGASVIGEPPIGRNVVFCGVNIFRIPDGKILERWRPERPPRSRARSQTCGPRTQRR